MYCLIGLQISDGPIVFQDGQAAPEPDEYRGQEGICITFPFRVKLPKKRAIEILCQGIRRDGLRWLQRYGKQWAIHLDLFKAQRPALKGADWVRGTVPVEPEIDDAGGGTYVRFALTREEIEAAQRRTIFVSHASADATLALCLKREFEKRIPGIEAFVSSDPEDLPLGIRWSPKIQEALTESLAVIVLATKRSFKRPWVWFEVGTAWFNPARPVVPLCFGKIKKAKLPAPLSELLAADASEAADLKSLFERLAKQVGSVLNDANVADLAKRLESLEAEISEV